MIDNYPTTPSEHLPDSHTYIAPGELVGPIAFKLLWQSIYTFIRDTNNLPMFEGKTKTPDPATGERSIMMYPYPGFWKSREDNIEYCLLAFKTGPGPTGPNCFSIMAREDGKGETIIMLHEATDVMDEYKIELVEYCINWLKLFMLSVESPNTHQLN